MLSSAGVNNPPADERATDTSSSVGKATSSDHTGSPDMPDQHVDVPYAAAAAVPVSTSASNRNDIGSQVNALIEWLGATKKLVRADGDGNCLFRSVAHQVYGDAGRHAQVRAEVCVYVLEHRDHFAKFIDGDVDAHVK
jgi:hypothetical protein